MEKKNSAENEDSGKERKNSCLGREAPPCWQQPI